MILHYTRIRVRELICSLDKESLCQIFAYGKELCATINDSNNESILFNKKRNTLEKCLQSRPKQIIIHHVIFNFKLKCRNLFTSKV